MLTKLTEFPVNLVHVKEANIAITIAIIQLSLLYYYIKLSLLVSVHLIVPIYFMTYCLIWYHAIYSTLLCIIWG